jgi:predicted TIM-barrel fold metal-dependent hydrolase
MQRYFGLKPLKEEASRYFREHFYWRFIYDRAGIRLRYEIGVDKVMWGNDFPHSAGDWPNSRRVIDDVCAGLPEDEKERILGGNVADFFRLT